MGPLFFDTTTAGGHFLIAIGKRNVAQRLRREHECLMKRLRALSPHKKRGSPHSCELPRTPGHHVTATTGTIPLLPKDRSEQSLALGLFLSVRTLGRRCHLTRLFTASTAHDLVQER